MPHRCHFIVDGNNVMHAARRVRAAGLPGRHALCQLVGTWARRADVRATIVFDGTAPRESLVRQMEEAGVAVQFGGKRTADEAIEALLEEEAAPAGVCVVTDDGALACAARRLRCGAIGAAMFLGQLESAGGAERAAQRADAAPACERPAGVVDVDHWLAVFGLAPPEGGEEAGRGEC